MKPLIEKHASGMPSFPYIKLNFNQPEFYLFVTGELADHLSDVNGLHEEAELLIRRREELRG